ncbi:MAG: alpha/beta hydrolase fold domain-containing protein [Acidimicrobiales bacterium]|nr:alpha/beta hydrolase fold domain-containing protein [Acidimicrobiales bacterium]
MDRTPREVEYSPSSCVESIDAELERYRLASDAAAARHPPRELRHGPTPPERLLVVEAALGAPLHVFVHGGYWQALGAADSWMPATESVASGTSFAAVDYTLAPAAPIGTIVEQCVRAVEVVVAELRPSVVTLSGSSAGAHLAALVAQRALVRIDRLLLLSGVFRLAPLVRTYVNDALGLDDASAAAWSVPLSPRPDAQVVVLHGEHETASFKAQSARLAAAWGVPTVEVCGRNHFDLVFDLAAIDRRLGRPQPAGEPVDPDDPAVEVAVAERPGAPRRLMPAALRPDEPDGRPGSGVPDEPVAGGPHG